MGPLYFHILFIIRKHLKTVLFCAQNGFCSLGIPNTSSKSLHCSRYFYSVNFSSYLKIPPSSNLRLQNLSDTMTGLILVNYFYHPCLICYHVFSFQLQGYRPTISKPFNAFDFHFYTNFSSDSQLIY